VVAGWAADSTPREPLGGLLAILGALYDPNVRAIAVRNGLANYSSILDDSFVYVPADITVPGFLEAGDIADVEAALAPKPMLLKDLIEGKNRLVPPTISAYTSIRSFAPIVRYRRTCQSGAVGPRR